MLIFFVEILVCFFLTTISRHYSQTVAEFGRYRDLCYLKSISIENGCVHGVKRPRLVCACKKKLLFYPIRSLTSCVCVCIWLDSFPEGFKCSYLTQLKEWQTCWGLAGFLSGGMVPVFVKIGFDRLPITDQPII